MSSDDVTTTVLTVDGVSCPLALEIYFVDDIVAPFPDRQPLLHFEAAAIERAIRRGKDFECLFPLATLDYVTNSVDLVKLYNDRFKAAGLSKYTFMIIPAVWNGP